MPDKTPTQAQKQLAKKIQLKEDYIAVFSTPAGKRVLKDLKEVTYFNSPSAYPHFQTNQTFFNDGAKSMIYHIENRQNLDIKHERAKTESQIKASEEEE